MKKQKVGILGSGTVGTTLGKGFASRGCEVKIGTREKKADFVTFAEAAVFGDLLVLATRWEGTENALRLAGTENLSGKILIDVTNPLTYPEGEQRSSGLERGFSDSGGEQIQRWVPGAKVVKAWNSVGANLMIDPKVAGGPPTMFIGGNDETAKKEVSGILEDFGWEVVDLGGIEAARMLEPMCWLWVTVGFRTGQWNHAFKLARS